MHNKTFPSNLTTSLLHRCSLLVVCKRGYFLNYNLTKMRMVLLYHFLFKNSLSPPLADCDSSRPHLFFSYSHRPFHHLLFIKHLFSQVRKTKSKRGKLFHLYSYTSIYTNLLTSFPKSLPRFDLWTNWTYEWKQILLSVLMFQIWFELCVEFMAFVQ